MQRDASRPSDSSTADQEPVPQGRFIVTVIGIDDYQHWPKLRNAVSDALGIQQHLIEKLGFSSPVEPLLDGDATEEAITDLVEDRLRSVLKPDDVLVLFFAGHGHTRVDTVGDRTIDTGYIVPVEARNGHEEHFGDLIQIDSLLEAAGKLPARHVLCILDACHSGFALGDAMRTFRSAERFERDLVRRVSRKVITSARRDQLALDSGPVAGHSLFTGTLINGLDWGRADLDGNGLITSSELGLFAQQQVGQWSDSQQTPDFGAFHFDDRGEMVISLRSDAFDQVKARAFAALQSCHMDSFTALVEQMVAVRPASPETLYLRFRQMFLEGDIARAAEVALQLQTLDLQRGTIPLSEHDLVTLSVQLPFWQPVLQVPDGDGRLEVTVLTGESQATLTRAVEQSIGTMHGFRLARDDIVQFQITNPTDTPVHVYMVEVDPAGRLTFAPLWGDRDLVVDGLPPGESHVSYPFVQIGDLGLYEVRLLSSPTMILQLVSPPAIGTRAAGPSALSSEEIDNLRRQTIRYVTGAAEAGYSGY